jgi:hypothetical protein
MRIRFSVDPARRSDLAGWRVNERDTTGANLELVADGDRTITPMWRGVDPTLPPTQ